MRSVWMLRRVLRRVVTASSSADVEHESPHAHSRMRSCSKLGTSCAKRTLPFVLSDHHIPIRAPSDRRGAGRQTTTSKAAARRCRWISSRPTRGSLRRSIPRPGAAARGASCWPASTQRRAPRADLQKALGSGTLRAGRDAVRRMAARQPLRRPGAAARNPPESPATLLRGAADARQRTMAPLSARLCVRAQTSSPTPPAVSIRSCCADSPTPIRTSRRSRSASSGPFRSCCGWRSSRISAVSPCRRCARGRTGTPRASLRPSCCRFRRPSGGCASSPTRHRRHSSSRFSTTCAISRSRRPPHGDGCRRGWARAASPSDEVLRIEQQREAIDQLSIANIISTMRVLSALDWPTFVEAVSRVERILRRDPAGAYADMDRPTRDRYRKSVEQLSRRSGTDELEVAERAIAVRRAGAA